MTHRDKTSLPEGFLYESEFVSTEEEVILLDGIRSLAFHEVRMRGVAVKRRVLQYDWDKNGRVSMLDAFAYTRREVETAYERQGIILTEHAEYSCCSQNARARPDAYRHPIPHGGQ